MNILEMIQVAVLWDALGLVSYFASRAFGHALPGPMCFLMGGFFTAMVVGIVSWFVLGELIRKATRRIGS